MQMDYSILELVSTTTFLTSSIEDMLFIFLLEGVTEIRVARKAKGKPQMARSSTQGVSYLTLTEAYPSSKSISDEVDIVSHLKLISVIPERDKNQVP